MTSEEFLPLEGAIDKLKDCLDFATKCEETSKIQSSIEELSKITEALRVGVKYIIFDLEATRRENAELRMMLEDQK